MSWDQPTGEKCAVCGQPMVKVLHGGIKCSNKDCVGSVQAEKGKKVKKAVVMEDDFLPPPLEEEPNFIQGYFSSEFIDDNE